MRIISDFRDFYDSVQAHDADRETIFLRKQETQVIRNSGLWHYLESSYFDSFPGFYPRVIGFCGKLYCFYHFNNMERDRVTEIPNSIEWVYNEEQVIHNLQLTREGKKELENRGFNKKLKLCNFDVNTIPDVLAKHDIFYAKRHDSQNVEVIINPTLKRYEFYRVKDVYTAYQELRMWIENKASPEKPIPFIDDKTMAEAKGFDKYSFRKDKAKP